MFQKQFENNKKWFRFAATGLIVEQNLPGQARSRGWDQKTDGSLQPDVGPFS